MSVHEEIIALGFRESGKRAGKIEYTRGNETLRHRDYGPSTRWPNPDANRHHCYSHLQTNPLHYVAVLCRHQVFGYLLLKNNILN